MDIEFVTPGRYSARLGCAFVLCCLATSFSTSLADTVHQRGGLPSIDGQITTINDAGVTIKRESAPPDFIRWDLVRDVVKEFPDPDIERFMENAVTLWRARSRLERQDAAMAEPLFERLFEKYRGESHETALLVAEGLLRCRLARGANDLAVIPALETARLRRAVKKTTVYVTLPAAIDEMTQLCPSLPPTWIMSSNLAKLERDLATYDAGTDTAVAAMAALYRRALSQQLQTRHDQDERVISADHPGVVVLRMMVDMQSANSTVRNKARETALRDLPAVPAWVQAWSYYFLGISMLNEQEQAIDRGLVNLAHLPARYGSVQPFLAGLALARLAEACDAWGDATAAASLRNELMTRYPHHPLLAGLRGRAVTFNVGPPRSAPQYVLTVKDSS